MKTKILIILLPIFLVACGESFLEITSETELSSIAFYKSQADFEQAINGVYAPLRELYNRRSYFSLGESRSDNAYYDYNSDNRGQIDHEFIADFLNDATNGDSDDKYIENYRIIARANEIINKIDGVGFEDQNVKDNIKGQALFLRALCYFDLVQYFGSIPLPLTLATNLEETALPLSGPDDVYLQIISDATNAITLLPVKSDQEEGRATKGAAQTLLGNVYIVRENWSEAVSLLQQVVSSDEYSLITTGFADIFDPNNKNNEESVFEVQYLGSEENYHSDFPYQLIPAKILAEHVGLITGVSEPQSKNGEGILPTPELIAAFESGDLRFDATIGEAISTSNGADTLLPYVKKYMYAGTHAQHGWTNNNLPIYRYSEVLLLLAEALNEAGSSGDALTHLNVVRNRAGLADITSTDQSVLRDTIMAERRVELAFECKRWLDLVRTGKAESVMKAFGAKVKANPRDYYFPKGITPSDAAFTNIETTFPIPASEEALNPLF